MLNTLRRSALAGLALSASALLFVGSSAFAASQDVQSTANIIQPLSIQLNSDFASLDFGDIVAGNTAGTVTIALDGSRTNTGGATLAGGDYNVAVFTVNGEGGHSYVLSVPQSVTLDNGTDTMTAALSHTGSGTLDQSGQETITVGGTLDVGANQAQGAYTGIFNVTANYQ